MRRASLLAAPLFGHFLGCTNPVDPPQGLSLVDRAPLQAPIATLVSAEVDDGFGAAVAVHDGDVWIGAPHGPEGRLYRWSSSEMAVVQSGSGRLGAHLSSTETSLLVSAPLSDRVTDQDGEQVFAGRPSVGIALSSAGDAAWAGGWITSEGAEGVTPGRPGALHWDGSQLAVGLPHGPVALAVGEQQLMRPTSGDEAGFSLSSAEVSGQAAWVVGAPAANRVFAVSKDDLSVIAEWSGGGRFGHTIITGDIDGDGREDLVVGAPFDGERGSVTWFSAMDAVPRVLDLDDSGALGVGTAIAVDESRIIIGAPGSPIVAGRVIMAQLPQ